MIRLRKADDEEHIKLKESCCYFNGQLSSYSILSVSKGEYIPLNVKGDTLFRPCVVLGCIKKVRKRDGLMDVGSCAIQIPKSEIKNLIKLLKKQL